MNKEQMIGYEQAVKLTLETILPLGRESIVDLAQCLDRIISRDLYSQVNSPSIDASMKDGYAVRSDEIRQASLHNQVQLKVISMAAAGTPSPRAVTCGTAIRIQTGARVSIGADAVLAQEFATCQGDILRVFNTAEPGRNILSRGTDVAEGELIVTRGSRLSPGMMGTLVAAGYGSLPVYDRPRVAILATGDELVTPGQVLDDGKLYASNLEMLKAWCLKCGFKTTCWILNDKQKIITEKMSEVVKTHDAVITSGGAWTGDRDFVAHTLNSLGWKKIFHRIRMGPGKAAGFGILNHKPVFLLPGGPPSNLTAFLQIALPGLLKLGGYNDPWFPRIMVRLQKELSRRNINWTEFVYGSFINQDDHTLFQPLGLTSRLKSMARAQGVISIPQGVKSLPKNAMVMAQIFV